MPKRFPRRAESGCASPFSARMNSTDATRYHRATWLADMRGFPSRGGEAGRLGLPLPGLLLLLEHLEHPLRDEESAEGIDRDQSHPDRPEDRAEVERARTRGEDGADHDHRTDHVRDAHQRRVQRGRHVPHHVIADEDCEHEHREIDDGRVEGSGHFVQPFFTTAPSMHTSDPAMISSSRLSLSSPDLGSTSRLRKFSRLRAYSALASAASIAARLVWPTSFTPCFTTTLSRSDSKQLPPCSTARSTITDPGFMPRTVSSRMSTGAGRPGISAVVMMMSAAFARSSISAVCRRL